MLERYGSRTPLELLPIVEDRKNAAIAANTKIQSPQCEDDPLIAKMKVVMASRGAKGLIGLARLFRILDIDESNTLSFEEFRKGMKEMALDLSETELLQLFKKFGIGKSFLCPFGILIIVVCVFTYGY